jgi:eukaryotic-like serine/threonine-protein kinase
MGKTALVDRFLDGLSRRGAVTLSGRCYEHEVMPFKALDSVVDALSRYLGRIPAIEAAEVLPKDIHALAQIFPVLKRVDVVRTARRRGPLAPDPRTQQKQAKFALKELLARIAMRQPLVMFIDDLQWGDVDSARVLAELVTGRERPPLLLICTYRSADKEPSPCLSTLLELTRGRDQTSVRQVSVGTLSASEAVELAALLLDGEDREQAIAVARESQGNPYLLSQLVDHLRSGRASAPELQSGIRVSLDHALSEQLSGLSTDAATILELVAVSGRPVREQVLAQLTAGEFNAPAALTELRRAKLVRGVGAPDARAIGIYHESIRGAVLARMAPELVRTWHTRLAAAIEKSEPLDAEALIEHLLGSEDHARAGIYAIGAARQAAESLAFNKAAELYEVAVKYHADDAWRQELLVQLAEALVSAGKSTRAADAYLQAADRIDGSEAHHLRLKAGTQLILAGRFQRGADALTPALKDLGISFPESDRDALRMTAELLPELQRRGFRFEPKTERELPAHVVARLDALWTLVQAMVTTTPILAQPIVLRHLLDALEAGEKRRIVVGLCAFFISIDLAYSSVSGLKPKSLQQAEALCRDLYDPRCRAWVALARGFAFQHEGLLKPASLDFAQAEDLFHNHCSHVAAEVRTCRLLYTRAVSMMGQYDEIGVFEQWIRDAIECEDTVVVARLRLHLVPRWLMDGDVEQVRRALETPEQVVEEGVGLTHLLHLLAAALLATYEGDGDAIARVADAMSALGRSPLLTIRVWRSDFLIGRARAYLAASQYVTDREPMLAGAERILGALERLGLECHADHVRLLRAGLHHVRNEREQALAVLESVLTDGDAAGDGRVVLACARVRKGQVLGGDAGSALIRQGLGELHGRGAKDPARFARLYTPGFDDPS